jgi:hypothetical protein
VVQNGVDAPGAQYRLSRSTLPGGTVTWLIIEYRNIDRKTLGLRFQDPGAVAFSLRVRNLDALATRVAAEGGSLYSRAGTLGNKLETIIIRDPNGFLIEFVESREP